MQTNFTRKRFIEELVTEHIAAHHKRQNLSVDTFAGYLEIEVDCYAARPVCRLIIRGNDVGTHWKIYETKHPSSPEGMLNAHLEAVKIVYEAIRLIATELDTQASIGITPMRYFHGWYS